MTERRAAYRAARRIPSEHDQQATVFRWAQLHQAQYPDLALLFAIPNGAATSSKAQAAKLKAEGLKAGVPDMFLAAARNRYHGLFIELKVKGRQPRPTQVEWLDALNNSGYLATTCWSAGEAIEVISDYLRMD